MFPPSFVRLIGSLSKLPSVGNKTAQRLALHLLAHPELASDLVRELGHLQQLLRPCEYCNNIAEVEEGHAVCKVCADGKRDSNLLCVVERIQDLMAVEKSGAMRGRYFVLGRLLSPLEGVGADDLPLDQLFSLIEHWGTGEVILATPPSVEGEATALFLARELSKKQIGTSRLASGIPHGGDLEYLDQITLGRAIDGRTRLNS